MKININKILISFIALFLIFNLLVMFDVNIFYIRAILSFLFIITVPGALILLILKVRDQDFWKFLVYAVGLSIGFVMFAGLAVNWILPFLHITDKPLSPWPILICFDLFLLAMGFFAYKRNKDLGIEFKILKLDRSNTIFFIIPMLFPVLSILGALILNNNGPDTLTMILLGGIAIYVLMMVIFRKKLNENLYPWSIFLISLSLLLMLSSRSQSILGSDISFEYRVLLQTLRLEHWSIENYRNTYNTCLSITILPTILIKYLNISPINLLKFIYPLLFSLVTPILLTFYKKSFPKILNFLATFFILSWVWFIDPMIGLARQEIGFIFFGLLIASFINYKENNKILFVIFGFCLIVSHYSTAYVGLAMLLFIWAIEKINKAIKKDKTEEKDQISFRLIAILLIFGFLWYSQVTPASNGALDFVEKTITNLNNAFNDDVRSQKLTEIIPLNAGGRLQANLSAYISQTRSEIGGENINSNLNYQIYPVNTKYNSEKLFGLDLTKFTTYLYRGVVFLIEIMLLSGAIVMIFNKKIRARLKENRIYYINSFFILALALMLALPFASLSYNFERLYMQALFAISIIPFLPLMIIKKEKLKKFLFFSMVVLLILLFLFNYGFLWKFSQTKQFLWLNNEGQHHSFFYINFKDISAAKWINEESVNRIFLDPVSKHILAIYATNISTSNMTSSLIPQTISKTGVIYLSSHNIEDNSVFYYYRGTVFTHNLPKGNFDADKNKIYNNMGATLYQ